MADPRRCAWSPDCCSIPPEGQRYCTRHSPEPRENDEEITQLRSVALAARALVQSVQPSLDADLEVVSESKLTELESMLELAGFGEE